ncbi:MAG: class I SAM-dependent methyltransferase [Gammaproteobacteria bacterium]|nr:class I SAM-dependent methyltransferase [Gammaproteobacteria bacterium]
MIICPDCHKDIDLSYKCNTCNWKLTHHHGISSFLSKTDMADMTFQKYIQNYDEISDDDLAESIQDIDYIRYQTHKFHSYLGSIQNKNVCEVGIGKGLLFDMLIENTPKNLVGIDISVPYLKKYNDIMRHKNDVNVILANAENIPYRNEFDLVVAADILEHVFNVGDFLYSVRRSLKDTGVFVVRTPYDENINIYSKFAGCKYDFVHLRNFSKRSLKTVLEGAGFQVIKFHFDGFYSYKKRKLFKLNKYIDYLFEKCMKMKYHDPHHVTKISNALGKFLMKPSEVVAVCRKINTA